MRIADRVMVMRDGKRVGVVDIGDTTSGQLVEMMVGRTITEMYPKEEMPIGGRGPPGRAPELRLRDGHLLSSARGRSSGSTGWWDPAAWRRWKASWESGRRPAGTVFLEGEGGADRHPAGGEEARHRLRAQRPQAGRTRPHPLAQEQRDDHEARRARPRLQAEQPQDEGVRGILDREAPDQDAVARTPSWSP